MKLPALAELYYLQIVSYIRATVPLLEKDLPTLVLIFDLTKAYEVSLAGRFGMLQSSPHVSPRYRLPPMPH